MASEKIESILINKVVDKEFANAQRNAEDDDDLFDSYIDLIDSVREPKDYDWMSDILEGVYGFFLQQATSMAQLATSQLASAPERG